MSWLGAAFLAASLCVTALPASAADEYVGEPPSAAAMGADMLLVRPLSLVATVAGVGLFVVSLPFSVLGDNTDAAAQQLVGKPGAYTFFRPLGEFNDALAARSRN